MSQRRLFPTASGPFEKRWIIRIAGPSFAHRNNDTRQLCAPRSTATSARLSAAKSITLFPRAIAETPQPIRHLLELSVLSCSVPAAPQETKSLRRSPRDQLAGGSRFAV